MWVEGESMMLMYVKQFYERGGNDYDTFQLLKKCLERKNPNYIFSGSDDKEIYTYCEMFLNLLSRLSLKISHRLGENFSNPCLELIR